LPNVHKLIAGSPQESTFVRFSIYINQIGILKAFPGLAYTMVFDDSRQKLLDFNLKATREISVTLSTLNPGCAYEIYIAGAHQTFRALWNLAAQVASLGAMKRIQFLGSKKVILDIVGDRNDIPDWWFKDGTGRVSTPCFNTLWEWERCLEGGERAITPGEIFNPTRPWEGVTWGEPIKAQNIDKKSRLQPILEEE
jgi:CRAL/TRIO domain